LTSGDVGGAACAEGIDANVTSNIIAVKKLLIKYLFVFMFVSCCVCKVLLPAQ